MQNISHADSSRRRAPWWFRLAGQLLQPWVRLRRDPAEPATLLKAGVLERSADGRIVFPYDEVRVDFTLRAA